MLLINYEEFLLYFDFPVSPKEFASVIDTISTGAVYSNVFITHPADTFCGKICFLALVKSGLQYRAVVNIWVKPTSLCSTLRCLTR